MKHSLHSCTLLFQRCVKSQALNDSSVRKGAMSNNFPLPATRRAFQPSPTENLVSLIVGVTLG